MESVPPSFIGSWPAWAIEGQRYMAAMAAPWEWNDQFLAVKIVVKNSMFVVFYELVMLI